MGYFFQKKKFTNTLLLALLMLIHIIYHVKCQSLSTCNRDLTKDEINSKYKDKWTKKTSKALASKLRH